MPTILRKKGYRFFFWSKENNEPSHIHIEKDDSYAKFWVNPVMIAYTKGFRSHEITEIRKLVTKNKKLFEDEWNEFFSHKS